MPKTSRNCFMFNYLFVGTVGPHLYYKKRTESFHVLLFQWSPFASLKIVITLLKMELTQMWFLWSFPVIHCRNQLLSSKNLIVFPIRLLVPNVSKASTSDA